jgi:hypothetical protein
MSIKAIVKELLENWEALRDDDVLLYVQVLNHKGIDLSNPLYSILYTVDYSYVVRQRALLQSIHKELRWSKYEERMSKSQKCKKEYALSYWDKMKKWFV